jgi:hypothetical protein
MSLQYTIYFLKMCFSAAPQAKYEISGMEVDFTS